MAKIKQEIIDLIKNDIRFQGALVEATGKHPRSIEYWLENNTSMLTTHDVLQVIRERTGKTDDEIFELEKVEA